MIIFKMRDTTDTPLAASTLCTVTRAADGVVDVQIGHVVLRLPERDIASLSGTLQKVVRQLFPTSRKPAPPHLELIRGGR